MTLIINENTSFFIYQQARITWKYIIINCEFSLCGKYKIIKCKSSIHIPPANYHISVLYACSIQTWYTAERNFCYQFRLLSLWLWYALHLILTTPTFISRLLYITLFENYQMQTLLLNLKLISVQLIIAERK